MRVLLERAASEIRQLRRECEIMHAKISMVELFDRVLHSSPPLRGGGIAGVDVAWELDKAVQNLKDAEQQPAPTTGSSRG